MASIRRYKDGRVVIVGDYSNGSPFVRQKWVRGEKSNFSGGVGFGDGDIPLQGEGRSSRPVQKRYKYVGD